MKKRNGTRLEAWNFGFMKKRNGTIQVGKAKVPLFSHMPRSGFSMTRLKWCCYICTHFLKFSIAFSCMKIFFFSLVS